VEPQAARVLGKPLGWDRVCVNADACATQVATV
jgi:hypothetical protein